MCAGSAAWLQQQDGNPPWKRYLYTALRFFLGINMVRVLSASAQGQLDSP